MPIRITSELDRMCLYYDAEKPTLVLSEQPGRRMMEAFLQLIDLIPHGKVLSSIVRSQVEKELIAYRIRACYEPSLRLDRTTVPEEETALPEEETALPEEVCDEGEPPPAEPPEAPPPTAAKKVPSRKRKSQKPTPEGEKP